MTVNYVKNWLTVSSLIHIHHMSVFLKCGRCTLRDSLKDCRFVVRGNKENPQKALMCTSSASRRPCASFGVEMMGTAAQCLQCHVPTFSDFRSGHKKRCQPIYFRPSDLAENISSLAKIFLLCVI